MITEKTIKEMPAGSYIRYKEVAQVYRFTGIMKAQTIDGGDWVPYYGYINDATGDKYARLAINFKNFSVVTTHG